MPLAKVNNPYVRTPALNPSSVYANSPYRPYAGIFKNTYNASTEQYYKNIIRAVSPYSVNDPNVIEAIRNTHGIVDDGSYSRSGNIGAGIGTFAGLGLSAYLFGDAISKLAGYAMYGGMLSSNPVGWGIAAAGTALAVVGTVMTSQALGRVLGSAVGSKEGSIALTSYLKNLGNSMINRPTTTLLTAATLFGTNFALRNSGVSNPFIRQGINMAAMRAVNPIAQRIDDEVFGELDDSQQMTYTNLISLQGDLADNFSGTSLVKAGAISAIKGKDEAVDQIAKMYGTHEEGFDALDFNDVREAWGVDIGTFGNGVIDMLGEIFIDADNNVNIVKNRYSRTIAKGVVTDLKASILAEGKGVLFNRYFEKVDGKIVEKEAYKNEFGNKKIEKLVEGYLNKYKDPSLAKTEDKYKDIEFQNRLELIYLNQHLYAYLIKEGLPDVKTEAKESAASKIVFDIQKRIINSLKLYSPEVSKFSKVKADYAESMNKMVEAQKQAYKKVNKRIENNSYNFDKALARELEDHNFEIHRTKAIEMLKLQPALRAYSLSNDNMMRAVGYFTRPTQSFLAIPKVWMGIKRTLSKSLRKVDPFKKITTLGDLAFGGEDYNAPITKEDYKFLRENLKRFKEELVLVQRKQEEQKYRLFLKDDKKFTKTTEALNRLLDIESEKDYKIKFDLLSPEDQKIILEKGGPIEEAQKLLDQAKKEAEKKFAEENEWYKIAIAKIEMLKDKYKSMRLTKEETDKKMSEQSIEFDNGKEIVRIKIDSPKKLKELTETLKNLLAQETKTGTDDKNIESIKQGILLYGLQEQFKGEANAVMSEYNNILDVLQMFTTTFEHDFAIFNMLVSETHIFKSDQDKIKRIQEEKEIQGNVNKELQKGKINSSIEEMKRRFLNELVLVDDKLKNERVLVEGEALFASKEAMSVFKKFKKDYQSGEPVAFEKHLATDVFTSIRMQDERDYIHFNNDPELFYKIENLLNSKLMRERLRVLASNLLEDGQNRFGKKFRSGTDFSRVSLYKDVKKELSIKLEKIFSRSGKDKEFKILMGEDGKGMDRLLKKLIFTRSFMSNKKGQEGHAIKRFSQMSSEDLKQYLFQLTIEASDQFGKGAKDLDNMLRTLQVKMNILREAFVADDRFNPIEEALLIRFNQKMSKIKQNNIIRVISSKYLKRGDKNLFFQLGTETKDEFTRFSKDEIKAIDEMILELPLTEDKRVEVKELFMEVIQKGLEKDKKLLEAFGFKVEDIEKIANDHKKEDTIIEQKNIEFSKSEEYFGNIKDRIVNIIVKAKSNLTNEEIEKLELSISNKLYDLVIRYHDYKFREEQKQKAIKRSKTINKQEVIGSALYTSLLNSAYADYFEVKDFRKILRGKNNKPNTVIDLENSPYRDSLLEYLKNNDPSLKTVAELRSLPFGFFTTRSGKPVDLQKMSQLPKSMLPENWKAAIFGQVNNELPVKVIQFLRYYSPSKDEDETARIIEDSYNTPSRIRDHFKNIEISNKEFLNEKDIKEIPESIAKDLYNELLRLDGERPKGRHKRVFISEVKNVYGNNIRIIRVSLGGKNNIDLYVPEQVDKNVYEITTTKDGKQKSNRYVKGGILGKEDSKDYLMNIIKKVEKDIKETFRYHKEFEKGKPKNDKVKFTAYESQNEVFLLFNKQRYLEGENQFISDFTYYDQEMHGDITKFFLQNSARLSQYDKDLIEDDLNLFLRKIEEQGYSKDVVQSDPKSVFKMIEVDGKLVSILDLLNPLAYRTEVANRSAHGIKALANAIYRGNEEEAMIQSNYAGKHAEYRFKTGYNMRTLLMDVTNRKLAKKYGTTFEDASIISKSAAIKYFGLSENDEEGALTGYKINDRYSGKYSFTVISDEDMKSLTKRDGIELVIGKNSVEKRGLLNIKDELALTKDLKKGDTKFLSRQAAETMAINSKETDEGFLYMSLTEDLRSNDNQGFKTAGDKGRTGAKLSTEEWPMLAALKEIFPGVKDMDKIYEHFYKRGQDVLSDEDIKNEIYGNEESLIGKRGKLRKVIEKTIPNSAYGKLMPDMGLEKDQIKIPVKMAVLMGIADEIEVDGVKTYVLKKDPGSDQLLLHRYPHQGRRSFAHLNVILDIENPGSKVIKINPWMTAPQNADFDGDGAAIFSLKGASKTVLDNSKIAFTHDYSKELPTDMPADVAKEISTSRSYDEVTKLKAREEALATDHKLNKNDFKNAILRAAILKRYSAYLKDVFDSQAYAYELDPQNKFWFNNEFIINDVNKEDGQRIYKNFYGFITELYDFYSQTTFDFSKHGTKYKAEIFKLIHDSIKTVQKEQFKDNIMRTARILKLDKKLTQEVEDKIITEKQYISQMKKGLKQIDKEIEVKIEENEEEVVIDKVKADRPTVKDQKKEKANNTSIKRIDEFLTREVNKIIKNETKGFANEIEKISDLEKQEGLALDIKNSFLEPNETFKLDEFSLDGRRDSKGNILPEKQILFRVSQLEKKASEGKFKKPFRQKLDENLRSFAANIVKRTGMSPDQIKTIRFKFVSTSGKVYSLRFNDMFKLKEDQNMFYFSPDRVNTNSFRKTRISLFTREDIKEFYVENSDGARDKVIQKAASHLYTNIGRSVVDFLNDLGYTDSLRMHPLLHNKILYQTGVFDDLFKGINGLEGGSNLGKILDKMNDIDSIVELNDVLRNFYTFQTVAQYVEGAKRTNIFKNIYRIKDIFKNKGTEYKDLNDSELKDILVEGGLLEKTSPLKIEDLIKQIETQTGKKFTGDEGTIYLNKLFLLLDDINKGITNNYNAKSQFRNEMTFKDKFDLLIKMQDIRDGAFETGALKDNEFGIKTKDLEKNTTDFEVEINTQAFSRIYQIIDEIRIRTDKTPEFDNESKDVMYKVLDKEKELFNLVDILVKKINQRLQTKRFSFASEMNFNEDGVYILRGLLKLDNTKENFFIRTTTNKNKSAMREDQRLNNNMYTEFGVRQDTPSGKEIKSESRNIKGFKDMILSLYVPMVSDVDKYIEILTDQLNYKKISLPVNEKKLTYFLALNKMRKALGVNKKPFLPFDFNVTMEELKQAQTFSGDVNARNFYKMFYNDFMRDLKANDIDKYNLIVETQKELLEFLETNKNINVLSIAPEDFIKVFFGNNLYKELVFNQANYKNEKMSIVEYAEKSRRNIVEAILKNREAHELDSEKIDYTVVEKILELNKDEITYDELKSMLDLDDEETINNMLLEVNKALKDYKEVQPKLLPEDAKQVDTYLMTSSQDFGQDIKSFGLYNIINQLYGGKFEDKEVLVKEANERILAQNYEEGTNPVLHSALIDSEVTLMAVEKLIELSEKDIKKGTSALEKDTIAFLKDFKNKKHRKNYVVFDSENIVSNRNHNRIYELSYITFDKDGNEIHNQYFLKYDLDDRTKRWLEREGFTKENIEYILDKQKGISDFDYNRKIFEKVLEDFKGKAMIGHAIKSNENGDGDIQKINHEVEKLFKNKITNAIAKETFKYENGINALEKLTLKDLIKEDIDMKSVKAQSLAMQIVISKLKDDMRERILVGEEDNHLSQDQKEVYIERMKGILEIFLTNDKGDDIYKLLVSTGLAGQIDKVYFDEIYKIYKEQLENSITKGLGFAVPEIVKDETKDTYVIKWNREEGDKNSSVIYDENDVFSNYMYKSAAFYNALSIVKESIRSNEMTYGKYEYLKNLTVEKPLNDMYFTDTLLRDEEMFRFKNELDTFKEEGNEVGYLVTYQKMLKRQESLESKESGYIDRFIIDLAVNKDKLDKLSSEESRTLANIPKWKVVSVLKEYYDNIYNSLRNEQTPEQKDFSIQAKIIVNRLQIYGANITQDKFAEILGIEAIDPIVPSFYKDFLEEKARLIQNGIPITLKGNTEEMTKVPYSKETENMFIQSAFYNTLYGRTNLYDERLKADANIKYVPNEEKENNIQEKGSVIAPKSFGQRVENEYNKEQFAKAREQISKWLVDEDWDSLAAYLKDKPETNKDLTIEDIKKEFYEKYETLKKEGLRRMEQKFTYVEGSSKVIDRFVDSDDVIKFIPGDKLYEQRFKQKVYNQMNKTITESILYVNSHRTSLSPDTDLNVKLTYYKYNSNLNDYDGKYVKDGLEERLATEKQVKESYDYVSSRVDKINALSKYQIPFNDIISYFSSLGKLDYERLYKEIMYGELGRIYRITIITDVSQKEKSYITNKIDKVDPGDTTRTHLNRRYDANKLSELRTSQPEYKDEKDIFSESTIDFMGMMRDTAHPTLKVIELSNKQNEGIKELKELVEMGKKGQFFLGFTTVNELFNTDKISYEGYRLPKPIAWVQSTIIQTQKALMLMNSGFIFRNLVDGFQRNYQSIVNSSNPFEEAKSFVKEGIRSWSLLFSYKKQNKIHFDELSSLKVMLDDYKNIEDGLNTTIVGVESAKINLAASIAQKIASLESYLKNIIADENQTATNSASSNYLKLSTLKDHLTELADKINSTSDRAEVKGYMEDYVLTYIRSGYFQQMVMNTHNENNKMNFEVNTPAEVEAVKDRIELLKFINEVEKSNIISDQYEIGVKRHVREIYKSIDELITEKFKEISLADRINNFMNGSWNIMRTATDYIEHTQRIHGVLLDIHHNGKNKTEAFANSLERFFNYGMKGAEETTAGVFFPFMSFAVRNLDFYMKILGDQKYVRFMTNLSQGISTWYNNTDEEDDYRNSNSFNDFTENQGWFPMGKNFGVKIGNSMFDALSFTQDPIGSFAQKLNPMIQQINNLAKGDEFEADRLALGTISKRTSGTIMNIARGNVNTPADVMPSLFYNYSQYTPYAYRTKYTSDYRNIYRDLFFSDGSRRTVSKNAFTNAKNIRYMTYRNARLNGVRR